MAILAPARRKILVADDNEDTLSMLEILFKQSGHDVFVASDGSLASELAYKHVPDLMVMDLTLPEIDGISLGKILRADNTFERTSLVAHTGRGELTDEAAESGFDYFALKPADWGILKQVANFGRQKSGIILLSERLILRAKELIANAEELSARNDVIMERSRTLLRMMQNELKANP